MDIRYTNSYETTIENARATLSEHGVAVIPELVGWDVCTRFRTEVWDYLEEATARCPIPIARDDPPTWDTFQHLGPKHGMLLQHHGVGQCKALWTLRTNPDVLGVYSKLYGCDPQDLVTSFDGMSVYLPRGNACGVRRWKTLDKSWLHCDQRYTDSEFHTAQSWITATDVNDGDATLLCIPGSHKMHKEAGIEFGYTSRNDDWTKLSPDQLKFYLDKGSQPVGIRCKAGSMVLWDSRTIHCGMEPVREGSCDRRRFVGYVCMQPRKACDAKTLARRIVAFETRRTASHSPTRFRLFSKKHRIYPDQPDYDIVTPTPPENNLIRRLVGYDV